MSEMAKAARAAMKAKAKRLGSGEPHEKVDASSWSPPEMMNTGAKTGMRPLTKRAYKKGGKVVGYCEGGEAPKRADRKQRKSGGRTIVSDLINRNAKKANQYRDGGDAHVGGLKRGGRAHKLYGGSFTKRGEAGTPMPYGAMKKGGKIHRRQRADGGPLYDASGSLVTDPNMGTGNAASDFARMNAPRRQAPAYSSANTTQSGINYSDMSFEGARDLARVRAANAGPQSFQWRGTEYPLDASAPAPAATPAARAPSRRAPTWTGEGDTPARRMASTWAGETDRAQEEGFPMSTGERMARQFQSHLRGEGRSPRGENYLAGMAANAGYKRGGKVHMDAAADKKLIKKALRQHDEHMHGGKHEDIKLKKGGKAEKWIAGAIKHPGALHKSLHVPAGEKIPAKKLAKAAHSDNPKLAKRARLAETLKRMHKQYGGSDGKYVSSDGKYDNIDELMRAKGIGPYAPRRETAPPDDDMTNPFTGKPRTGRKKGGKAEYNYLGGTRPTGGRIAKADGGEIFREDNTEGYSAAQLKRMNREHAKEMLKSGLKPDDDRYAEHAQNVADKIGNRDFGEIVNLASRRGRKAGGRAKGKTNIIIAINPQHGGHGMMQPSGMPPMGPTPRPGGAAPVAPPTAPMPMLPGMGNLPPGAMPPGGGMPGAGMMPPGLMPRKAGGRVYRSYKDMDAGAGSGLGRLEKAEIQRRK